MPTCDNCGSHVTPRYVRVAVPKSEVGIQACPHCPDRIRAGGGGDWRRRRDTHKVSDNAKEDA